MSPEGIRNLHPDAEAAACKFLRAEAPLEILGGGVAGAVFKSPILGTAVKIHKYTENFEREIAAYKRLHWRRIRSIQGFSVPHLERYDAGLRAFEMSSVRKPYLLDFAGTMLDRCDFTPDAMSDWWDRMEDRFEERFPVIQSVYWELVTRCRIYYTDFKEGNIEFVAKLPKA